MKKHFMYAMIGAIALTGAVGFTSCAETEDVAEVNPGYNPETGEVPVNFVFNVETGSQSITRMSASAVQIGANTFRGITNANLFSYKLTDDGKHITDVVAVADRTYDLNQLIASGQLHGENGTGAADVSRRVLEMSLPTGTNTLMFWGRAMKGTVNTGKLENAVFGGIDYYPNENLNNAYFSLKPCVPDDTESETKLDLGQTALSQYETLIAKALNDVINTSTSVTASLGGQSVSKVIAWKDYVNFANDGTLTMKEQDPSTYVDNTSPNMSPLGEILANTFITLNTFDPNELRNGQGKIIAALMGDLNTILARIINASATTVQELAAQNVATAIQGVIGKYFTSTPTWKSVSEVINQSGLTGLDKVTKDLNKFPDEIFHLPPGATVMLYKAVEEDASNPGTYNIVNQYSYMSQVPTYAMGSSGGQFNPKNYMFPAELCYFGNSPIRVTSDAHEKADYPDGATNWVDDNEWKANATGRNNTVDWTKNSHVISSTRSVAMQENINYGTALLKTSIVYESGIDNLLDNNANKHTGEAPLEIPVANSPFEITGILVGGQPQTVGWNYLCKSDLADPFICMVYDNDLPSTTIPTPTDSENYTLVWDNWNESRVGNSQNTVYIAVELKNNSNKDFWGLNNVIRSGSNFYLIGKLDPDKGHSTDNLSDGITWPGTATGESGLPYALPPYGADGNTIKERRVFIQDYVTTAKFIIGKTSLQTALVSVPDLRASQISLGLSVDLSWSNGLNFETVLGEQ